MKHGDRSNVRSDLWLAFAIFVCAAIYFTPIELIGLGLYDEGIRLVGAQRVLNGEVPYRDFYTIYGPGQFYWPALLFKVFGVEIISTRIGFIASNAVAAAALFALCRRLGVSVTGSLLVFLGFLLPRNRDFFDGALDPAIAFVFVAAAVLTFESSRRRQIAVGMLAGMAALFRHDFGIFALTGAIAACAIEEFPWPRAWRPPRIVMKSTGWLLAGFALTAGVVYGALAALDWHALVENLFTYPAVVMPYRRLRPFTGFLGLLQRLPSFPSPMRTVVASFRSVIYLAAPALVAVGFWAIRVPLLRTLLESKRLRVGVMFLVVVTSGFSLYGFGRSDWYRLIPLYLISLPLIAVLGHLHCAGQARWHGAQRMALIAAAVACLLVLATRTEDYLRAPSSNLEKARGIALPQEGRWVALAVNDLQADSGPLFVAAERHDRILVNALGIYFLSGRAPGVYFAQFDPGITTTESTQRRIIDDLKKNDVRTVFVGCETFSEEPNQSSVSSGIRLLDDFLGQSYVEVKNRKVYRILKRRE